MIAQANSLDAFPLADSSVHMCVTSPPYWGLRDYGVAGQLGLEATPDEYVAHMVQVFREVWRVLRDDGIVFLNLGDSYYNNPGNGRGGGSTLTGNKPHLSGAKRVAPCGTSGKAPASYPDRDCLCENLCGVCLPVYRNHKSRNDGLLAAMLTASLSASNHGHTELQPDHLPTLHSSRPADHSEDAIQDRWPTSDHDAAQLRAVLESTIGVSGPQLLDECLRRASSGVCLLCARSLASGAHPCADNSACPCASQTNPGAMSDHSANTGDSGVIDGSSVDHKSGTAYELAYPYYTTSSRHLKHKDLCGIPWRVAFALQADGWWLRSDVIWSKPNPMPESVTDRPTKSHEYLFLLAKQPRYYYDATAIAEPASENTHMRISQDLAKQVGSFRANGGNKTNGPMKAVLKGSTRKPPEPGNGIKTNRSMEAALAMPVEKRNKRTVWTITSQGYGGAHFATFPPALVEIPILAGSRPGDIVLDPFCGSGTTGMVARQHGRRFVGLDLSLAYLRELALPRAEGLQTAASIASLPLFSQATP